jgi:hypothetical protein
MLHIGNMSGGQPGQLLDSMPKGPQHISPGLPLDCSLSWKETPKEMAVLLFLILCSINHQELQCYAMGIRQKSKPVQFMYFYVKNWPRTHLTWFTTELCLVSK